MRIVIDMQGAQTESRLRGIGRYTLGLVRGMVRNTKEHEIHLALNGMLPEGIESIRQAFKGILPHEQIHVWYSITPLKYCEPAAAKNRVIAEKIYVNFLESLQPDVVLITSMMEGWNDPYFCDLRTLRDDISKVSIIYDFIPYRYSESCLNGGNHGWYSDRLRTLADCDLGLSISDYTRIECSEILPLLPCYSISSAADTFFQTRQEHSGCSCPERMGIPSSFIFYAGGLEERKNIPMLFDAFRKLPKDIREAYPLVLPCGAHEHLRNAIERTIAERGLTGNVILLGRIPDEDLCILYSSCTVFIFPSLSEGFGLPVLEAMQCGAPVIGSNTSSIPEVIGLEEALFDPHDADAMAAKLEQALTDPSFRDRLLQNSKTRSVLFSWDISSRRALRAIEKYCAKAQRPQSVQGSPLQKTCAALQTEALTDNDKLHLSFCLARTFDAAEPRQLLVDIGNLASMDIGTGIQRVTRNIIALLLKNPPKGYVIRPVYATADRPGYVYAHDYCKNVLHVDDGFTGDVAIDFSNRDIFLGLDLQAHVVPPQMPFLQMLHRHGVRIYFVVYDLVPILYPQFCVSDMVQCFSQWLRCLSQFDGIVAISRAVTEETRRWFQEQKIALPESFLMEWFHLGSDITRTLPSRKKPEATFVLERLGKVPSLLMVSTVEPRKGYAQALDAIEILWKKGKKINLVIVGRQGWHMDDFAARLRQHPQQGKQLFWLDKGISDEYLDSLYEAVSAILVPSEAEGFGLALVEGARHSKPLILRDIPVFREIAGDHAFYFSGLDAEDLAGALSTWVELYKKNQVPLSNGIRLLTWKESSEQLLDNILNKNVT